MMINSLPPQLLYIASIIPFLLLKGKLSRIFLLIVPVLTFVNLIGMGEDPRWTLHFLEYELVFDRVDRLSLLFGYIFLIMAFIGNVFAFHLEKKGEHVAGLLYVGSSLGVVFAGDFLSLFIFWELMTVSAVYLVFARKRIASFRAGIRYFFVHLLGGLFLLIGIIMLVSKTGSAQFSSLTLGSPASYLILLGFGINCAFPLLHAWVPDSYPEGTITGTIFLSIFTTKTAVYVLARGFPGADLLIPIGTLMAVFPIFYAVIENDLRRVLCYSLINQVGFMVVGIGIGTDLSINGAVAHAFTNILFEGLLFLTLGGIMYRTGKINATDLGGLYKSMPVTAVFCIIGAASISGFPLFSGFVSKSMIVTASANEHMVVVWFALLFAAAGVFHHAGIKIPFFAFFSHDSGIRTEEPPMNMMIAMGIAAFLSILIGVSPNLLYDFLPFQVDYHPYTAAHVIDQLQLLMFSALAFTLLLLSGIYPAEIRAINLDVDWIYRRGVKFFMKYILLMLQETAKTVDRVFHLLVPSFLSRAPENLILFAHRFSVFLGVTSRLPGNPEEKRSIKRPVSARRPVGETVFWITIFLAASLFTFLTRT
ncbi:MAG: Na(+)/H(+) antiporter subunit D [Nitrospinota bacterium]